MKRLFSCTSTSRLKNQPQFLLVIRDICDAYIMLHLLCEQVDDDSHIVKIHGVNGNTCVVSRPFSPYNENMRN